MVWRSSSLHASMSPPLTDLSPRPALPRPVTLWNSKVAGSQEDIKRFIAYTEIFLMIIVTWNTLT